MQRMLLVVVVVLVAGACRSARRDEPAMKPYADSSDVPQGPIQTIHAFTNQYPTGVAVSREGRIFISYPRWVDPVTFTVGEIFGGEERPYPSPEANGDAQPDQLFSVQSVHVDARDRLWALDTGSVSFNPIRGQEWAKLVGIDLRSNRIFKIIRFDPSVVLPTTYLNDVRVDVRRGEDGVAFISDSSMTGPNAIIVVDLASGRAMRRLNGNSAVTGDATFAAVVEGQPLLMRPQGRAPHQGRVGVDGIALSADGKRLFFCPLSSRTLYTVDADALVDGKLDDAAIAATIQRETRKFASDGLEGDEEGRIYLTDWEHNAVVVREPDGTFRTAAQHGDLWWPDSIAIGWNGYLYVTANQLHRLPWYHGGQDQRSPPYRLMRMKIDGTKQKQDTAVSLAR